MRRQAHIAWRSHIKGDIFAARKRYTSLTLGAICLPYGKRDIFASRQMHFNSQKIRDRSRRIQKGIHLGHIVEKRIKNFGAAEDTSRLANLEF